MKIVSFTVVCGCALLASLALSGVRTSCASEVKQDHDSFQFPQDDEKVASTDAGSGEANTENGHEVDWSWLMEATNSEDADHWLRFLQEAGGGKSMSLFSEAPTPPPATVSPTRTSLVTVSPAPSFAPTQPSTGESSPPATSPAPSFAPTQPGDESSPPSTSPAPSDAPSPLTSIPPTPQNGSCVVDLDGVQSALQALFDRVAVFRENEILNKNVPFLGSSMNTLIGGEGGGSIDAVLNLTTFVEETFQGKDIVTCDELETELASYLERDGMISTRPSTYCDGTNGPVTVTVPPDDPNGKRLNFCSEIKFDRKTTLDGTNLFAATGSCIELETDDAEDITSSLVFGAELVINRFFSEDRVALDPIETSVNLTNGTPDVSLFLGLLNLECTKDVTADAFAAFKLAYCVSDCTGEGIPIEEAASFYLQYGGDYSIEGVCSIGDPFPGVELTGEGGTTFVNITEDDIYSGTAEIDVRDLENLKDFLIFCPEDALSLLRRTDSTLIRTQQNIATELNLPLTNIMYSEMLSTGSAIVSQFFPFFVKFQDFDKRAGRSLFLSARNVFNATSGSFKPSKMLELYIVRDVAEDMMVNPDDSAAVRELADQMNGVCTIKLPEALPQDAEAFRVALATGIDSCGIKTCRKDDCTFDNTTAEIYGCECDLVVDLIPDAADGLDRLTIASVVYRGQQGEDPQDVQLIGLYEVMEELQGPTSLFEFPLNQPVTPGTVPRFRTSQELVTSTDTALTNKAYTSIGVGFSYVQETEMDPSRFEFEVTFVRTADFQTGFATRARVGDLENIRQVDKDTQANTTTASIIEANYSASLGVILAPNENEQIIVLGRNSCDKIKPENATEEQKLTCPSNATSLVIEYFIEETSFSETLNLPVYFEQSPTAVLASSLASLGDDVVTLNTTMTGASGKLMVIKFDSSISRVKLFVPKDCIDLKTEEIKKNVLFCDVEREKVLVRSNVYGLQDQDLSRRPFQITVKQSSIDADVEVKGTEKLVGTAGPGCVEVDAGLDFFLRGDLSLSVGTGEYLPFNDWLIAVSSLFQPLNVGRYIEGFLDISSTFQRERFSASVQLLPPFNDYPGSTNDDIEFENPPFEVDFEGKNSDPTFIFDIDLPGGITNLTFSDAVSSFSKAVSFVVGDRDINSTLESCTGGLLSNKLVSYQIPLIGTSACSEVDFLQVLVNAADALTAEVETEAREAEEAAAAQDDVAAAAILTKRTLSSLQIKLETLLTDDVGKPPVVELGADNDGLLLKLELSWEFVEAEALNVDLTDILKENRPDSNATEILGKALIPSDGAALIEIKRELTVRLDLRVEKSEAGEVNAFINSGPIFTATFLSNGTDCFEPDLGALCGTADVEFSVGQNDSPLTLIIGLTDEELIPDDASDLVNELNASFFGLINADIDVEVPLVELVAKVTYTISNLEAFSEDSIIPEQDFVLDVTKGPIERPDVFELLYAQRVRFVEALDVAFRTTEAALFSPKGAITRYRVPFIQNSVGSVLGASTDNNILSQVRRKIIPKVRDSLAEIDVGETETVKDILNDVLQVTLLRNDFLQANGDVSVECFDRGMDNSVECNGTDPTTVMWTVPLGQDLEIQDYLLNFVLVDEFPLEIPLNGDSMQPLNVSWAFNLAFGFDDEEGFFLYTFPEENKTELLIETRLNVGKTELDASLYFLSAKMKNVRLIVGAAVFVDVVNLYPKPRGGLLTRGDFRKTIDKSSMFKVKALSISGLESDVTVGLDGSIPTASWIPTLNFSVEAIFRTIIGEVSESDIADFFVVEPGPDYARISAVQLDQGKTAELVSGILEKFTNQGGDGVFDRVVAPLVPLNTALPGISDIAGREITVLDIADIYVGKSSGSDTVRTVLDIYQGMKNLATKFAQFTGGLLLAEECNLLDGFSCTGGLPDEADVLRRKLKACDDNPNSLECTAQSVCGLDFPVLSNPLSALELLKGRDIRLVTFESPLVELAFEFDFQTVVYTPPTVRVGIEFEFVATLQVLFALDSKGVREAIEQEAPGKAINSFALIDTFKGVDIPMITLTGLVAISVSVSAFFVEIGVTGGVQFIAVIDLFDPKPEQSGGLVRPYELLSAGTSPLEWFEFSLQINLFIKFYVRVIIDLFFGKIEIYKISETFTVELLPSRTWTPELPGSVAEMDITSGQLLLRTAGVAALDCTSLGGSVGSETIECFSVSEPAVFNSFPNLKQIGLASSGGNITLRDVQSVTTFSSGLNALVLNYSASGAELMGSVFVGESQVLAGANAVNFASLSNGKLMFPQPEEQLLLTTFGNCNSEWKLEGHSNLLVNANEVNGGCKIVADGGNFNDAQLIVDFGYEGFAECQDGNEVILTRASDDLTRVVITRPDLSGEVILEVSSKFTDLQIKMSQCNDKVLVEGVAGERIEKIIPCEDFCSCQYFEFPCRCDLEVCPACRNLTNLCDCYIPPPKSLQTVSSTLEPKDILVPTTRPTYLFTSRPSMAPCTTPVTLQLLGLGSVSVYGGGGNDTIAIGSAFVGLDDIPFPVIVDGGDEDDFLIVEDSKGSISMNPKGQLNSGSLAELDADLGGIIRPDITYLDYENIETLNVFLGTNTGTFEVTSTAPGSRPVVKMSAGVSNVYVSNTQGDIEVSGGDGDDNFFVTGLAAGAIATVLGSDGDDVLTLSKSSESTEGVTMFESNVVRWSGGAGNDLVHAFFNTQGQYDLELYDDVDGINTARITCDSIKPCNVWSRENFIASTTDTSGSIATPEKITIDHQSAYVHAVALFLSGGENKVFFDDTVATMDVFGGPYSDVFYIGQKYSSPQSPDDGPLDLMETAEGDYLSKGNSHPVTINGDSGIDTFNVLRNTQVLDLNGDAGDDVLVVESFLASPTESEIPDYVVNSLIDFDGGTGEDSVDVMGTDTEDSYVVTATEVIGGGLSIKYKHVEELDVGETNDELTLLSIDPALVLDLIGDSGHKPDVINPRQVDAVVSKNLRGHVGIIEHLVSSDDDNYDGLYVEGVAVNVLDDDGDYAYIGIKKDEEKHVLSEDGSGAFAFDIFPVSEPNGIVAVDIIVPVDLEGLLLNGASTAATTLTFDGLEPQTVQVTYQNSGTGLDITERDFMIKVNLNMARTTDERFRKTRQSILPIDFTVTPGVENKKAKSVTVAKQEETIFVVGGGPSVEGQVTSSYDLVFHPCPAVDDGKPNMTLSIQQIPAADQDQVVLTYDTTVSSNQCVISVDVAAGNNGAGGGFVTLQHTLTDPAGEWTLLSDNSTLRIPDVTVRIYDADRPGVLVEKTQKFSNMRESRVSPYGTFDTYSLRLTKSPAPGTFVNISIQSVPVASDYPSPNLLPNRNTTARIQTISADFAIFDNETWNEPKNIFVFAVNDEIEEGVDYFSFPPLPEFDPGDARRALSSETTHEGEGRQMVGHDKEGHSRNPTASNEGAP